MTLDHAAQAAADREGLLPSDAGQHVCAYPVRDLYVRAFRQGAQEVLPVLVEVKAYWDRQFVGDYCPTCRVPTSEFEHTDTCVYAKVEVFLKDARVEPLTNSPTPKTGSTAQTDNAESPPRGKS